MPSYDYKCKGCEQTVSVIASIEANPQAPICSACKVKMIRDYKFGSVAFRGKGFYSTDK